jgi:diacylglycerol kinase family enzyme
MASRRLWAFAAVLLIAACCGLALALAIDRFPRGVSVLACLVGAGAAAWYGIRRRGAARNLGLGGAGVLLAGAIVIVVVQGSLVGNLIVIAAAVASFAAARRAFTTHTDLPRAPPPRHPVLFYNPLSGGGKATRFHLAEEARRRGIEPVELRHGDDLEQLVREHVARGADGLAMAGGDGSQAIVAQVAAELGLPYACVPAGTRNHFALDLGVDRDDVVGALDAFVNGGERRVDLAEVNGRVFVNNVSLGLYAEAVQSPGYRAAKLHTILATVPEALGPDAEPPHLSWSGDSGEETGAVIMVSNNGYRLGRALHPGTRPRLDQGVLGIAVLGSSSGAGNGAQAGPMKLRQWTSRTFEIEATGPVAAGIDGEATILDPPLHFRSRAGVLRARIAPDHPGASPSMALPASPSGAFAALLRLAFGRATASGGESGP